MSKADRRRRLVKWCRYLNRARVPYDSWQHRASGCANPRPSGLVRAWDRVALHSRRWPWRPRFGEAAGRRPGSTALLAHDLPPRTVTVELPEEEAA